MKAVRLHRFGGPEVLEYEEVATPELQSGQVLIRMAAAGVNPIDWKTREGGGAAAALGQPPIIPGWECAGLVEAVADENGQWQPGDRVCGLLNFPEAGNCYAELISADAGQLAPVPESVNLSTAGGLSLAGLTAWQALFDNGKLQSGQQVLILAAAGGVGHLAVQLAKWKGARVIGTASAANLEYLRELGCDQTIDYQQQDVAEVLKDVDLIIDAVGGKTAIKALGCLNENGVMVTLPSVTAAEVAEAAGEQGVTALPMRVRPDAGQLKQMLTIAAEGKLQLRQQQSFPLVEAPAAHQLSQTGRVRGKIILTP